MLNGSMRLLVVDDLYTMRSLIRKMLKEIGYGNVEEADNGVSALSKLRAERFDLVITDWNMPQMDGLSLLEEIRKAEDLADLPVLMVTAEKRRKQVIAAAHAGASGYVVKPFSEAELARKLDQIATLAKPAASAASS
jgi:two-component system chemotaxis response regulator CheY